MKYYLEITLLPNGEVTLDFLWSKVYQQIHLGLVEIQHIQGQVNIGFSFPNYQEIGNVVALGKSCRLFAPEKETLEQFDIAKWLVRLTDYVHYTSIRPVPDKITGYACYQRYQPKTNPIRLARRYASRHDMDWETVFTTPIQLKPRTDGSQVTPFRYCDLPSQSVGLPFIRLTSLSKGQSFCLWIKKIQDKSAKTGAFSTYGLSSTNTVPEF